MKRGKSIGGKKESIRSYVRRGNKRRMREWERKVKEAKSERQINRG